jgi:hypothetical protein
MWVALCLSRSASVFATARKGRLKRPYKVIDDSPVHREYSRPNCRLRIAKAGVETVAFQQEALELDLSKAPIVRGFHPDI